MFCLKTGLFLGRISEDSRRGSATLLPLLNFLLPCSSLFVLYFSTSPELVRFHFVQVLLFSHPNSSIPDPGDPSYILHTCAVQCSAVQHTYGPFHMGGYEPPAQMGLATEHTADHRSPHVRARTPCNATLDAKRPETLENASLTIKKERPKFRPATDDFSEFTNRSAVIVSSRPDAHKSTGVKAADLWSPVLYDPGSDSVRIIPPNRSSPLASQFREFKDKINVKTHRLAGLLSPEKSETQPLPLRLHESGHQTSASVSKIQLSTQPSSNRLGRANWKDFE